MDLLWRMFAAADPPSMTATNAFNYYPGIETKNTFSVRAEEDYLFLIQSEITGILIHTKGNKP
jgi:hypothetical protein